MPGSETPLALTATRKRARSRPTRCGNSQEAWPTSMLPTTVAVEALSASSAMETGAAIALDYHSMFDSEQRVSVFKATEPAFAFDVKVKIRIVTATPEISAEGRTVNVQLRHLNSRGLVPDLFRHRIGARPALGLFGILVCGKLRQAPYKESSCRQPPLISARLGFGNTYL